MVKFFAEEPRVRLVSSAKIGVKLGRTSKGLPPKCVEACAVNALMFVDYDNLTDDQKALVAKSVAMNEKAGTQPKVRYIASHCDIAGLADKVR